MRRFLKILAIVFASILSFMLLLSVAAKLFEDDIAKVAIQQVSKTIAAPVEIGSVNFNLVRGFPKSTIEFRDLWLMSPQKNSQDTIAGIHRLYVSVNSRAAIDSRYEIEKIEIDGLALNYIIHPDSLSNVDFLMHLMPTDTITQETITDSAANSTSLYFNLKHLLLRNISCGYIDSTSDTRAKIKIPEIVFKGNIMGDNYTAETNGQVSITDLRYSDYKLQLMQRAALNFNLHYIGDSVNIKKFTLQTEGLDLSATGLVKLGKDITTDLSIKSQYFDLGIVSQYMPQEMMTEMGLISAQGALAFNTTIRGTYNDSTMPRVDADFSFENGAIRTTDYPEVKHFSFVGKASNGAQRHNMTTSLDLSSLKVATAHSSIHLVAHILNIDQPIYKIKTEGTVNIDEFTDFIPEGTVEAISGDVKWNIRSSGQMPLEIGDDFPDYVMARTWANISVHNLNTKVDSTLSIENCSADVAYQPQHFSVQNLSIGLPTYDLILKNSSADMTFTGLLTDIDNMAGAIHNLHLEFDHNSIDLQASVSNLTHPDYTIKADLSFNLADLQKFVPDTLVTAMSGIVNGHIASQGSIDLDSIENQGMALAFQNTRMALNMDNVSVAMADSLLEVSDLNLAMEMKPDTISIHHFSGDYKGLDFALNNTQVINAYNTVLLNQHEQLTIITSIRIGDIDFALFEPFMPPTDSIADDTLELITNYTMDVKGEIAINSFTMKDYEVDSSMTIKQLDINSMACKFRVTDSTYIADSLAFNAFGGHMLTSARYDVKTDSTSVITIRNHIDGMDFKQLLYDMDNFGQSDVTYDNISGQLLSEVNVELTMIGDSIPMDNIRMKGDFTLTNGGVFDFEPAKALSKFTGINELDNIRFQTLSTQLFILQGAAYIPKTDIISSALDISAFGMQTFGDDYEYHLELHLGDVLTGKSENLMKRQERAAKEEKDEVNRNGVSLVVYSLDGKTKNGFDNKKAIRRMTNKIRTKEAMLYGIFNPKLTDFSTNE